MAGSKSPWTSARCNRLLRPLLSKIALLRKATLYETRHDQCNSAITSKSVYQNPTAATKVENEVEVSPRPWKKIKRTYSSRTKGQRFRDFEDHDKDRTLKEAMNDVIRVPLHLTAAQVGDNDEDVTAIDARHHIPTRRALLRVPRSSSKNAQIIHSSQVLSSAGSAGLSNQRLIEGIYKALEALLRATTCEKTNENSECRSLFSICLRQIPNYIAQEQRLTNDEDDENDIDVASEVYTDLEAFGLASDSGWESLREVVRAHGISLVGEAIQERLVDFPISRHILSLCLGLAAYDEAECVVESMIASVKCRSLPRKESTAFCAGLSQPGGKWDTSHRLQPSLPTKEASRVAGALKYFASQTGRHGFMYRQTAVMLEDGILPAEWTSSKSMIECWNGVIRSITQEDQHAQSATLLLQVATSKSYRREVSNAKARPQVHDLRLHPYEPNILRPAIRSYKSRQAMKTVVESQSIESGAVDAGPDDVDNALKSTFSSILTVLSAINILRTPKSGLDSSHPDPLSLAILRDIALEIRQVLELNNITSFVSENSLRLPLLSAGLVSIASRKAGTSISPSEMHDLATLASLPSSKETLGNAGSFLGEIARCGDEAGSGDGFRFLQVMVLDLISISISSIYDKPTRKLCRGIAHAAAFAFSEYTGQPKHLDWALEMEGTIIRLVDDSPKVVVDQTPARADMRNKSGYRWEEGICEWIAKTPAQVLQHASTGQDIDHDRTNGEAPKLTLAQALPIPSGISPCVTDRRLTRPRCEGASSDSSKMGNVRGSCGDFPSSEKLLFIRISPRPHKVSHPNFLLKLNAANDLDELSAPESSQEKPAALREIPNLSSDLKRKRTSGKHNKIDIGSYDLDMSLTNKHRWDTETFYRDTDDELGFL